MFIKNKNKIAGRISGIESRVGHLRKLLFKTNNETNSVLEELRVRRFVDIQEEICCRAVWRWAILDLSQSYKDGMRNNSQNCQLYNCYKI